MKYPRIQWVGFRPGVFILLAGLIWPLYGKTIGFDFIQVVEGLAF